MNNVENWKLTYSNSIFVLYFISFVECLNTLHIMGKSIIFSVRSIEWMSYMDGNVYEHIHLHIFHITRARKTLYWVNSSEKENKERKENDKSLQRELPPNNVYWANEVEDGSSQFVCSTFRNSNSRPWNKKEMSCTYT